MKSILVFVISVFLVFCSKPADEKELIPWNVTSVQGPTTGSLGQEIGLEVSYWTTDGCDVFERFEQVNHQEFTQVKLLAYVDRFKICTQSPQIWTKVFSFIPRKKGNIVLRFFQNNGNYLSHTIAIN